MSKFHQLQVSEVKRETEDTVSVVVNVPETLAADFKYIQGQYLTFKQMIEGEEVRRSYSLCSSPATDNELRVAIKKVEGGKFSTFANENLKQGDVLEVMPPMGNFYTDLNSANARKYVAFAAGSGITPIMSILKTTLATEQNSTFTLIYGNRSASATIFKAELDQLKAQYGDRFNLVYVMSREAVDGHFEGRITAAKCQEMTANVAELYGADDYFLCGPVEMIEGVTEELKSKGVDGSKIHFELFTTPVPTENGQSASAADPGAKFDAAVTVIIDGDEVDFDLSSQGEPILDAALDAGADVPFACKGAVCCTCRAKVLEGSVRMEMNYALDDDEVEEGYILTCQSHPTSEKVVVDYDAD